MPSESYLANYVSKAANYTLNQTADETVAVTAACTLTLPSAAACFPGQAFSLINNISSGGALVVAPNGTDTINGVNASDTTLQARYSQATFATDGVSRWFRIYKDGGADTPPQDLYVSSVLGAFAASAAVWTAPNDGTQWQLKAASVRFTTASSSGTLQVEVAAAATALGSGTVQLTGTLNLAGTANTTVNGTVIASPTAILAGTSVNAVAGGTLTSLAGCVLTLVLQRLA